MAMFIVLADITCNLSFGSDVGATDLRIAEKSHLSGWTLQIKKIAGQYSCPVPIQSTYMASEFQLELLQSCTKPSISSCVVQLIAWFWQQWQAITWTKVDTDLWSKQKGENHMLNLWVRLYGYSFSFSTCHTSFSVHNIKLCPEGHIACTAWAIMPMSGLAKIELLCGWRVQGPGLLIKIHVEM